MNANQLRSRYLKYMEERGHAIIPSSALVPENDPTTLFTGSGMQPLILNLMGQPHPMGKRLVNSQKCFRANDIEEVGDNRHTTFFEMLGNWSLGDYFKKEQISWFFDFLVDEVGLDPNKIYVTVFAGDESLGIPRDDESVTIWKKIFAKRGIDAKDVFIGTEENGYKVGLNNGRIFYYDSGKNWWSRSGKPENMPIGEIGGPDSEVFYDFGPQNATHPDFKDLAPHPNSDSGQFVEIGNSVFIEYIKGPDGSFKKLDQKNVDFGGGFERITAASNNDPDVFKVDLLWKVVQQIEKLSGKKYQDNLVAFRIITDHIRGSVFLINDGVLPGNTDQDYFVRRLLRRAVRYADKLGIPPGQFSELASSVIDNYGHHYSSLNTKRLHIKEVIETEEEQFRKTLELGLKQFSKISLQIHFKSKEIKGKKVIDKSLPPVGKKVIAASTAFDLYTTYGFPIELTMEIATEKGFSVDLKGFAKLMEEHKAKSKAGAEQKFKGGLADSSEQVIQLHTVTHLMLSGLQRIVNPNIHQAGSNITAERLRFDLTYGEKIKRKLLDHVENFVNQALKDGGNVFIETMPKVTAENDTTIEASFWDRYPDEVKVYTIKNHQGEIVSRELCGGPHVKKLEEIKKKFRIVKEESSSAGVRRIKAVLE